MSEQLRKMYDGLSNDERNNFWRQLRSAMMWRGWDNNGEHKMLLSCKACKFIADFDKLCVSKGVFIEEYT